MNKVAVQVRLATLCALVLLVPSVMAGPSWNDPASDHETTVAGGRYPHDRDQFTTPYDVKWEDAWTWESAGPTYQHADIRRVAFLNETIEYLNFEIDVASKEISPRDPYPFDRVSYNIYLDFNGQEHLIHLARSMWGTIDRADVLVEAPIGGHRGTVQVQETDTGWRLSAPKSAFTDPEGFLLWKGDVLRVTRIVVMDTYHDPNRADFEETHTCTDDEGNEVWCFPLVRDIVDIGPDAFIPVTLQPESYGPLVVPEQRNSYGRTPVTQRGYNSTYYLEIPVYNLDHGPGLFDVDVRAPEGWRVIRPASLDILPRVSTTVPLAVMVVTNDGPDSIDVTLTSRANPNITFTRGFVWNEYQEPALTPTEGTLYLHTNHAGSGTWPYDGTWFNRKKQDSDANPQHAAPVMPWQNSIDGTTHASQGFRILGPGYLLHDEGVQVSWNATFPAAFEGRIEARLENTMGQEWTTLSQLDFGTVSVQPGETRLFQGALPTSPVKRFPPGVDLRVQFRAEGEFGEPPEGVRPIDYGMPPSAMHDGKIAVAVQQQDTWVRFPLLPYNDTFEASLFPDPILAMAQENYDRYRDAYRLPITVNEVESYRINLTNQGLVPAVVTWEVKGPSAEWVQPVQRETYVPAGGQAVLELRYIGSSCFTSWNSTTAQLVGDVQGFERDLTTGLAVDVSQGAYDALPPQCLPPDNDAFLPAPGILPILLAVAATVAIRKRGGTP